MSNRLRIVGAGPGDPDLLTMKAARVLSEADVVLYDALVQPGVIDRHASAACKRVYVGKREGGKEFSQDDVNRLLVFYARRYKHVVRLTGGDQLVDRGHEEIEYCFKCGIEVEVIPGISSATAAPLSAGIPLTKRGVNQSFWVVTASTASGDLSRDVRHAAASTATVIVLMGVAHLAKLASLFASIRGDEEPVAVVQYPTWPGQYVVRGNVKNIAGLMQGRGCDGPGVIIFGQVLNESCVVGSPANRESDYIHL